MTGFRHTIRTDAIALTSLAAAAALLAGCGGSSSSTPAAAAGADGVIVEAHPNPDEAICDGLQSLHTDELAGYIARVSAVAALAGKRVPELAGRV